MNKDIAIFTDNNIAVLREDSTKVQLHPHLINSYTSIVDIIEICRKLDLINIWIAPYIELGGKFTAAFLQCSYGYGVKGTQLTEDEKYIKFVRGYKKDNKDDICITIPEYNPLWCFEKYDDISPNDLLLMLAMLREKLPVGIYNSPTNTGIRLLEELTPNDNVHWLRASDFIIGDIPASTSLVWRCEKVVPKKYIHAYDKRGAFLSSYQSTMLGSGNAKHYNIIPFDSSKVGVWRVKISGNSIYNGIELPLPYNEYSTDNWLWTPEIKITQKLGYNVQVEECYLWEEAHYIFRQWARMLWDTREELRLLSEEKNKLGYKLAYDSIKYIYTKTGGRLAHRNNTFKSKDVYNRHDWFYTVIADTKLKVLLQIDKLVQLGFYPIMVETDCLYYLSDEKDGDIAIPTILDHKDSLGGYKRKYSTEWSRVQELFESGIHPNSIATELNKLEREGLTW